MEKNAPAYDLNGKRIVDNISTPSQTILRKKALTPVTVSKNQELTRKRTKDVTGLPQTVKLKPVVLNSPPRNIRLLKKPVEPTEIHIKIPEQQAPPTANDHGNSGLDPPDPVDPGSKESIPSVADPDAKPVQHASPKPVEPPLRDHVNDEETPTEDESSDDEEHDKKLARLSDEFLQAVRRIQRKKGLPDDKDPITTIRIQRYLRGAEHNPDRAAENYVNYQNSYLLNESSEEERSRDRSRSRERSEDCNANPRGEEPIDLVSDNDANCVENNPKQNKLPPRERSRSCDRHVDHDAAHQKPLKEPGSKTDPNLSSKSDDDLPDINSLNGMLEEEEEKKLPDDQLQRVVDTSNVNTPSAPPIHPRPPDLTPDTVPSQAMNQTQKPMHTTHPPPANTPLNQSSSMRQPPVNVTGTPTRFDQKHQNKSQVFPPPGTLFSRKQQKKKDMPISTSEVVILPKVVT